MTRILVADDSSSTRLVLKKLLTSWGYEMVEADDGRPAWDILQGENPPRIAILDWNMPEVDGVYVCQRLAERRDGPFIYSILLTSMSDKEDLAFALQNGAHAFLGKPVHPEVLRSSIVVGLRLVEADDRLNTYAHEMERLARDRAQQLVHTERLATLGTLAAGVAHEINNPLTYISGTAETMRLSWKTIEPILRAARERGEGDQKKLDAILRSLPRDFDCLREGSRRIAGIVARMREYSRKGGEEKRPIDLRECVRAALELTHSRLKHKLDVLTELPEGPPPLKADPQQIEQVLINLFANAADAHQGEQKGRLLVRLSQSGGWARLVVEDDGPGIPPDKLDSIWDPFYTTKPSGEGTGLGLSISKGLIEDHGGHIWAENRSGGGARFIIELPLMTAG